MRPLPTLDHVVVNTRLQLDEGAAAFRRLGFTLAPRGHHTLGSSNNLAIFGNDYLELIGVRSADSPRTDVMGAPLGLQGLVFGAEDSTAIYEALVEQGVPCTPPMEFSRPVELPGGAKDAVFRTIHIEPPAARPGRIYFCHHFTRDLVWRDEWRQHANGVVAVSAFVIAAAEPTMLGGLFGRMFGADAVRPVPGGVALTVGLADVLVLEHAGAVARFGAGAADADGLADYMAGLEVRTRSLTMARAALAEGGVVPLEHGGRLVAPASAGMGCPIAFVE